MKNFKNSLFSGFFLLMATMMFAQGKVKGKIVDSQNGALPGVNVVVKGTSTGTSTDFDGKFTLNVPASGQITISFIGFQSKAVSFTVQKGETKDLGTIQLAADSNELSEVVVKSTIIDVAKDRKTPVAVSTIKAAEIQQKLGNQEFPEILKNTPSVYTSKGAGGFGDSRMTIRGFAQENIAVMINGVPVNDMENGAVYWSNWAGLSDVTTAMQVQRGLGSSKLAIASVGGTVNVLTRTSDKKEGGSISSTVGNNNYLKWVASYNTGKLKNGFSSSILMSRTIQDGYVQGTEAEGYNYFIGLGYEINPKHNVMFTFTGAPQWHSQKSTRLTIADYLAAGANGEPNVKYNRDAGYLQGKRFNIMRNFYSKPVMSLNYEWKVSDNTKVSAVGYASWGRGGGSGAYGRINGLAFNDTKLLTSNLNTDYDRIYNYNSGNTITSNTGVNYTRTQVAGQGFVNTAATSTNTTNGISMISGINSHDWYGGLANLNTKLNDNFTLDFGIDVRSYKGIHTRNLNYLFGATSFLDTADKNNPTVYVSQTSTATPSWNPFYNVLNDKAVVRDYDGLVNWYGGFTQLEYASGDLTAFIQAAVSQQGFKRVDRFSYLASNPLSSTSYKNLTGGNFKAGLNYNLDKHNNVFGNAGYYLKQPFFNSVYPNNLSVLNENVTNEKILGFELGYGYRSDKFNANVNLYRTSWKDRYVTTTANIDHDGLSSTPAIAGTAFLTGVEQIHTGAEVDFSYKPFTQLSINGSVSIGNWKYGSNVTASYQDINNNVITNTAGNPVSETLYINGLKVGNTAQTTASIGASYEVVKRVSFDANYNFVDNLYSNIDPSAFKTQAAADKGALKLPSYGLLDAGFSYKMLVGKDKANSVGFRFNVNNVLDTIFIAESSTNIFANDYVSGTSGPTYASSGKTYDGVATGNQVNFGFGRTWNFGITYNF